LAGLLQAPVPDAQVPTSWHWSSAVHTTGLLPLQTPVWHVSVCVHLSPSLQPLPSTLAGFEQTPFTVSQVPTLWHWSSAVHSTGLLPVHTPLWQVSVLVQALLSLQALPSTLDGFEQTPVFGSQLPALWHWSLAVHDTAPLPVHLPALQASVLVQASPSSQLVPSMRGTALQLPVTVSHVPTLQESSKFEQLTAVPFLHMSVDKSHVSTPLHGFLSSHCASLVQPHLLVSNLQPVGSTQLSTVHAILSSQVIAPPPHTPAVHLSALVHVLPSLHSVPSALAGLEHVPSFGSQVPAE